MTYIGERLKAAADSLKSIAGEVDLQFDDACKLVTAVTLLHDAAALIDRLRDDKRAVVQELARNNTTQEAYRDGQTRLLQQRARLVKALKAAPHPVDAHDGAEAVEILRRAYEEWHEVARAALDSVGER